MTTLDDMSREAGWYDRRYTAMKAEIEKLEDKCDRLREALEKIANMHEREYSTAHDATTIARTALQETGDEN